MNTFNAVNGNINTSAMFQNRMGGRSRAVLYLFSKRYMPVQYRRSYRYSFGHDFNMALNEKMERMKTVGGFNRNDCYMRDVPAAASTILPDPTGQRVDTSALSDQWTFVLIVDSILNAAVWEGTANSSPIRDMYTGWIIDEPIRNHFGGWMANPGAVFTTTHHMRLNAYQEMGPTGMKQQISVIDDKDYLPGQVAQTLQSDGQTLLDLRPEKVVNGICADDFSDSYSVHGTTVQNYRESIPIDSSLNTPVHHLGRIVSGIADTVNIMRHPSRESESFDMFHQGTDVMLSALGNNLTAGSSDVYGILDPSKPFNFDDINQRFPDVDVQIIRQPENPAIDLIDAGAATPKNVFSSLLASSLPGVLTNYNFADVAFSYCSWRQPVGALPGERGTFEFQGLGPLFVMSPEQIQANADFLKKELMRDIFPSILMNCGEFYLTVKSTIAGESIIDLRLMDWSNQDGFIEQSNRLGGLNTPLIGVSTTLDNNARQIFETVKTLEETNRYPTTDFMF